MHARIYTRTRVCVRARACRGSRLLIGVRVYFCGGGGDERGRQLLVSVCVRVGVPACGCACVCACVRARSCAHKHKVHHHNNTHRKEGGSRHAEKPEATRSQKCVPQCYHQLHACVCVCVCVCNAEMCAIVLPSAPGVRDQCRVNVFGVGLTASERQTTSRILGFKALRVYGLCFFASFEV
jgi:hypothetical protein